MKRIIIDCGATSTQVAVKSAENVVVHELNGFNPQHGDWQVFSDEIELILKAHKGQLSQITLYGAGLSRAEQLDRMKLLLSDASTVESESIAVYSDLMACAQAAYDKKPIIVGILGTGSNIGYFDGQSLTRQTPSLGYILADEGSSVDMGRRLLKAHLYGKLPLDVSQAFDAAFDLDHRTVIKRTYEDNEMRALCGDLAKLGSEFDCRMEVMDLISKSFSDFIDSRLTIELDAHPEVDEVCLFGSVAEAYGLVLADLIKGVNDKITLKTSKSPLDLMLYML